MDVEGTKHRGKQTELAFGLGLPVATSALWSIWQLDFSAVSYDSWFPTT